MSSATDPEKQAAVRFSAIVEGVQQKGLSKTVEQVEGLLAAVRDPDLRGEMERLLGFYWLDNGNYKKAITYSDMAAQHLPADGPSQFGCAYNAVFALLRLGRWGEVIERAQNALETLGEHFVWHSILSASLGYLGRLDEAHVHGTRTLQLKDSMTANARGRDLANCPVPPFDPTRPRRNIISFSLFGTNPKYLHGALLNAQGARFLYLGWTCRFHVDGSVPERVVKQLASLGAQVVRMPSELPATTHGTVWRFLVADDPNVDRYILRDADSVVNLREAVAVQEWIGSGRHFHVMRDHYDHTDLVLAGMWGGVRGALPQIAPAFGNYLASRRRHVLRCTEDQQFLREVLWPTIRESVLVHDSQFGFGERSDFPSYAQLPPGSHIGCNGRKMLGLRESIRPELLDSATLGSLHPTGPAPVVKWFGN